MSRIGKLPIPIPKGIEIKIGKEEITVNGKNGMLSQKLHSEVQVVIESNTVKIIRNGNRQHQRALHGLYRSLINNMVIGVSTGFKKSLEINGIGYRANVQGSNLVLNLGYSHPINFEIPKGIKIEIEKSTIHVTGADKQMVGKIAADIRRFRPVEPYKHKGIKYVGEYVRKKVGKTGG
ncbi:MAG: 50S ribosomal protein L6 [Candidatus Schekmanbacteria bacterium RBG_13_48_7]|uniref:Large ribosomal subunit protein uL6 n=1 Tax=Candidatus Schekmanbacteria bacterium RBG_13_48_7 TaxID=1817878 RepID=A0A1F7S372_9BACT|nr:ribosomal protein L6 [uncultured bacterium]OGL47738.1 MAG: 50S ribosomal protein L6 [Candidatus Schekmanbacteria bacterium RBG_13_48_7]